MAVVRATLLALLTAAKFAQVSSLALPTANRERERDLLARPDEARASSELSTRSEPNGSCISPGPAGQVSNKLNNLLSTNGKGYILRLCQNTKYEITSPLVFTAANQEISTVGYPRDGNRALLLVAGPQNSHTTAIQGTCNDCDGIKIRNVQINGNRNHQPLSSGGGNIEIGGPNSNQLVEYTKSWAPRAWTCLHVFEGGLNCDSATIQYNDIGPCGSDAFQQWSDGISFACKNGHVHDNTITNPTDGGIVVFGSPGTVVERNTITTTDRITLGGINLVDYDPWSGDFTGVKIRSNTITGPFANSKAGSNSYNALIKIGIAMGPRVWVGNRYGSNVNHGASVTNNKLSGAFGYGLAVSAVKDWTVQGNSLSGANAFIGVNGPYCQASDRTPSPTAYIVGQQDIGSGVSLQGGYKSVSDTDSLTCIVPPSGGDYWPAGKGVQATRAQLNAAMKKASSTNSTSTSS